MWHTFKKDLFSYYSKKVNGIMRTCHRSGFTLSLTNIPVLSPCDRPLYSRLLTDRPAGINYSTCWLAKCWWIWSKSKLQFPSLANSSKLENFSLIGWTWGIVAEVLQFLFQMQEQYFSYFSRKAGFDITCKLSKPVFWENKKNILKCLL